MFNVIIGKFFLDDRGKVFCFFGGEREGVRDKFLDKKMIELCFEKWIEIY